MKDDMLRLFCFEIVFMLRLFEKIFYGCCKHLGVPALRLVPRLFCLFSKLIRRWDGSRRHSEYTAYRAPVQGLAGNSGYPFYST